MKQNKHFFFLFVKHILLIYSFKKYICAILGNAEFQSSLVSIRHTTSPLRLVLTNPETHLAFKVDSTSFISHCIRANKRHRSVVHLWDYRL